MQADAENPKVLYRGRHIELAARGKWEFARRPGVSGIVGIIAVTDDRKLVLVEQDRPPVGKRVIEIPAGLAGDVEAARAEELADAARRELLEETGYDAASLAGALPKAAALLAEAARLAPDVGLVYQFQSNVAHLRGDRAGVVRALERAVALDPDNQLLQANLSAATRSSPTP